MIEGVVNAAYEAVIDLLLRGPAGQTREIEAVIDTGYTGFLALPADLVSELGLAYKSSGGAFLADGNEVSFGVYDGAVLWEGQPRHIEVDETGTTPLVGMRLLDSHRLYIEVEDGGRVVIQDRESPVDMGMDRGI